MKPVALAMTPKIDQHWLKKVSELVERLPNMRFRDDEGRPKSLDCHILAVALGDVLRLRVVHGYYASKRSYNHSWLLGPKESIIDPYPVYTVSGPILVGNGPLLPGPRLYFPATKRLYRIQYEEMFSSEWFACAVQRVAREFRKM
jgi:hypothetical protein